MATLEIPKSMSFDDCFFAPTMQIALMLDHYAVIANGYVVGTIERSPGSGNEGMWGLHWLDGKNGFSYVPLHYAMQEAMKWRRS